MKLLYLKARNVLSFGDEDTFMEFGSFNAIAGPNDSGKTNLFRALGLIEIAFEYGKPSLGEIIFQGDSNRPMYLEVGIELDDIELELLVTCILCSEIMSVVQTQDMTKGVSENPAWKTILTRYGSLVLSKSFRSLSFVLSKDELNTSEPKMMIQMSDGTGILYLNRHGYLSETAEEPGSYQRVSLAREIVEDFSSRFGDVAELDATSLVQNTPRLAEESPTLVRLLKGKLDGSPRKMVELRGSDWNQYSNALRGEPMLAKLSRLCEQRGIGRERLYLGEILEQIYRTSLVRLQELRVTPPTMAYKGSGQDSKKLRILGSDLALRLFQLMNSGAPKSRERYNRIRNEFRNLTDSEFDVAVRMREVTEVSEGELGVELPPKSEPMLPSDAQFVPLGIMSERRKLPMNEAYIQVVKGNYPIAIEQAASGLYEILFLLTTIIGESGKVLLLDEPELHLHPNMQKRILSLFSESKTQGRNQILMITHSPYLLSAEGTDATWRFTKTESCTKVLNLGRALSKLESQDQQKLTVKLSTPDVRSILFSRGVIFVDGLSDKIVVEQIDKYLSTKDEGANIDESEWSVVDIGGKKSLSSFMTLSRMLEVQNVAIMDYDALMHREHAIRLNGRELKTSSIIFALWRTGKLKNWLSHKAFSSEVPDSEWYEPSLLEDLRNLVLEHGIFVFSADLEGVMQSLKTNKMRKPLKALGRILELIDQDKVPPEFYEMCRFLRKYTSPKTPLQL